MLQKVHTEISSFWKINQKFPEQAAALNGKF
jgi:hypothetical protein